MVLPLVLARRPIDEMEKKVQPIAEMLGIEDLLKKYPYELSGGQQATGWHRQSLCELAEDIAHG